MALLAAVVLAAGCSSDRDDDVIALQRPVAPVAQDARRLPLSTPPVYWVRPGSEAPAQQAPRAGIVPAPPPIRSGEDAILRAAGATAADPNIREQLARAPGIAVLPDRALEGLLASGSGAAPGAEPAQRRQSRPLGD
jgi:hypothetical protein